MNVIIYKGQEAEIVDEFGAGLYEIRILATGKYDIVSEEFIQLTYPS